MAREPFSRYVAASHIPPSIAASTTAVIMAPNLRDIFFTFARRGSQGSCRVHRGTVEVKADTEQQQKFRRPSALGSGRVKPELFQQGAIARGFGIAGGEKLVAVKNRIRPGKEAQGLDGLGHLGASRGEPHGAARHGDARARYGAYELTPVELGCALERSSFHLNEIVDRDRFGLRAQAR